MMLMVGLWSSGSALGTDVVPVAGEWHYRLDPRDVGRQENWFAKELPGEASAASGVLSLPGTLDTAGVAPNTEAPTLMRLYRATKYVGPAWYEREIEIPAAWQGKRVTLFLERVHCNSRAWLDGRPLGYQDSLAVPHVYELGMVAAGRHRLTLCINNIATPDIGGTWAHSVGENTQVNWNGVIGRMELQATEPVYLADVQVFPDVAARRARVVVEIGNASGNTGTGEIRWTVDGGRWTEGSGRLVAEWGEKGGKAEFEIRFGDKAKLWDEFSPAMQELTLRFGDEQRTVRFGMREFKAEGRHLVVNGRRVFLRGTLDNCVQPLTGYPPMDEESWRRIFRVIKSYGLNFVRYHSWCPPEAAFRAADEEGMYLLPEAGAWYHDVGALPERDRWMEVEATRIVKAYGNHPSFCLFTLGNEMECKDVFGPTVDRLIHADPRRLYSSHSGMRHSDPVRNDQFRETDGFHGATIRNLGDTPSTLDDFREAVDRAPVPLLTHEMGLCVAFPNVADIPRYTGVLKPGNYELIRDHLARKGLLAQSGDFVQATGKLCFQQYKNMIEQSLRTPGLGGFSLYCLQDFPGQGMAMLGMVDAFWESKGITTPEAWREFCGETVPLLRFEKRVYTTVETFSATAEVANYGPCELRGIEPTWTVRDGQGKEVAAGRWSKLNLPTGGVTSLGKLELPLAALPAPCTLTVAVALAGTPFVNRWDIHVYPATPAPPPPADVLIVREWGAEAKAALVEGRKVFLQILPETYENSFRAPWRASVSSPLLRGLKNQTMGGLFDVKHPAFARFPTQMYRDFRWYDLASRSVALLLDATPLEYRPIAQMIDNHGENRKLGELFEARVGPGRLLACGFNVWDDLNNRPEARQLLRSLYNYMDSAAFSPPALDEAVLDQVFRKLVDGNSGRLGVRLVSIGSEAPGFPASSLLDGNPRTVWRSAEPLSAPVYAISEAGLQTNLWKGADAVNAPVYPKEIVLELPRAEVLRGVKLVAAWGGRVKGYAVYTRGAQEAWVQAARGECNRNDASETVLFAAPRPAMAVKLLLTSGVDPDAAYASLAEIELLPVEK
jgi:hypothetical protein